MLTSNRLASLKHKTENEFKQTENLSIITQSLCPECLSVINALIYEDDGKIYMRKKCNAHGVYRDLISSALILATRTPPCGPSCAGQH